MNRSVVAILGVAALALVGASITYVVTSSAPEPEPVRVTGKGRKIKAKLRGAHIKIKGGKLRAKLLEPDKVRETDVVERLPSPTGTPPEGSDLLIVTWDTVRADHVSAYGYPRQTTPVFDALAEQGVLFERFVVPQSTTLPTHVSLFTGTHPDEHGIVGNSAAGSRRFVPAEGLRPLARQLSDAGYRTGGFVSSAPLKDYSGIEDGFQTWSQPHLRWRRASDTTRLATEWIDDQSTERPLFLWVHHYDPHSPYRRPRGFQHTWNDEVSTQIMEQRGGYDPEALHSLKHQIDSYDLEIRYVDSQLQPLLDALERRGTLDRTILVVAGDHGEGLTQHDHMEHGLVWPEQLSAPLLLKAPGVEPSRVASPTTAQDLLPLLAAVGEFPNEAAWLEQSSGRNPLDDATEPVLSRTSRRQLKELKHGGGQVMAWSLQTETEHFIYREDGNHALYDLSTDPYAARDRAASEPARVAELAAEVERRLKTYQERKESLGAGKTETLDPQLVQDLEALGYIEEASGKE